MLDGIASFFGGKEKKKKGSSSGDERPSSILSSTSDVTDDLEWTDDEDDGADAAYMAAAGRDSRVLDMSGNEGGDITAVALYVRVAGFLLIFLLI